MTVSNSTLRNSNPNLEKFITRFGGLVEINNESQEEFQKLIVEINQLFIAQRDYMETHYKDTKPKLEFGFLMQNSIGGVAYVAEDPDTPIDFIGIYAGTIHTLHDTFNLLLSDPEFLDDVGDPSKESGEAISSVKKLKTNVIAEGKYGIVPKCEIRKKYATELTLVALCYLFFHEAYHLFNGHLEYLKTHLNMMDISKDNNIEKSETSSKSKIIQTLELDADQNGIKSTLEFAFGTMWMLGKEFPGTIGEPPHLLAAFGNCYKTARLVTVASYVIFRVFDNIDWSWEHSEDSHPVDYLRIAFIHGVMHKMVENDARYKYDPDDFKDFNLALWVEIETVFGRIQGIEPNYEGIGKILLEGANLEEYIYSFHKTWAEIHDDLSKGIRGGKLAPALLKV